MEKQEDKGRQDGSGASAPTLIELAAAFNNANAHYKNLCMANTPANVADQVSHDLEKRRAMRAMMAAEKAYNEALDAAASHLVGAA